MSEGYQMPKGVVFSLHVLTVELDTGGVELAVQSDGKVFVARAATWEDAYWELRRKVRAG